jgi:CRP/FNR family transcriptional regulator, cyclic AMP receptor protein
LIERYQGDNHRLLVEAIRIQPFVEGGLDLATEIASVALLEEMAPGQIVLEQDAIDNDLILIISGSASIYVNKRKVAERKTGQHVGEMALIDATARRSATVIAKEETVIARVSESDLSSIAERHPRVWRLLSVEIAKRLRERGQFLKAPNEKPQVFIGSSREALEIARTIERGLPQDEFVVRLWTHGVFEASATTIESLERLVKTVDFAVLVFSPDDRVFSREVESKAPRDNIIFELGLGIGALGRERSFIVRPRGADLKIPTDLLGVTPLTYDAKEEVEMDARMQQVCADLTSTIRKQGPR